MFSKNTEHYIKEVIDLSDKIVNNSRYVYISQGNIEQFVPLMPDSIYGKSDNKKSKASFSDILNVLLASSVNFCFWYGDCQLNRDKCRSSIMEKILNDLIGEYEKINSSFCDCNTIRKLIEDFHDRLCENRFPMMAERRERLYSLYDKPMEIINFCHGILDEEIKMENLFPKLFSLSPEFGDDMFLKRAFLFQMEIKRKADVFRSYIYDVLVPADYQIPKVLKYLGIIDYVPSLKEKIDNGVLIPKGSREECEIRASTIIACKSLAQMAGTSQYRIDQFLFSYRDIEGLNHHLTITTDY